MARCNDCNRFVSYGDIEAEIESELVDNNAVVAEIRITLTCADCGSALKEAQLEFEQDINHECKGEESEYERYEILSSDATGNERRQTTGKGDKPVPYRYQKQFYGADVSFEVRCNWCGEDIPVAGVVEEQASAFEEMY